MLTHFPKKASIAGAFLVYAFIFLQGAAPAAETVRVSNVVDGDSLHLADGRKVRLIGINAPEMSFDGRADEPLARRARDELNRIIAGREITLETGSDKKDRYGRTLAYVVLPNGKFAGEMLVESGLAATIAMPPNIVHLSRYRQAEAYARSRRLGIWSHSHYRPIAAESLKINDSGFRFVNGEITRVGKSRKYIYFNLTPGFAVAIKRAHWHYFGGQPENWLGRKIIARGWISRWRDKLRMRIGHPAMLEVKR